MQCEQTKRSVSQRTAFYSQKPEGRGALVEGFTGYWRRLASTTRRQRRRLFQASFYLLDGSESHTERWVNAMERATCQLQLRNLTLAPLIHVCEGSWLRRARAWCPFCYASQKDDGGTRYEPLIWSIRVVSACPVHHTKLEEKCLRCQKERISVAGDASPGYCPHCNGWLGAGDLSDVGEQYELGDAYQLWCSEQICDTVYRLPDLTSRLDTQTVARALHLVFAVAPGMSLSALADLTGAPRRSLSMWLDGATRPRIDTLCRFCFKLKLPVLDFMLGRIPEELPSIYEQLSVAGKGRKFGGRRRAETKRLFRAQEHEVGVDDEQRGSLIARRGRRENPVIVGAKLPKKGPERERQETALQDALRTAVDEGLVTSPRKIAMALGFHSPDCVLRKFPLLTGRLNARIRDTTSMRKLRIRTVLEAALTEVTPPTLHEIAVRLKLSSSSALRLREPELCDQLLDARKKWRDISWGRAIPIFERAMVTGDIPGFARFCTESGFSPEVIGTRFPDLKEAYTAQFRNLRLSKRHAEIEAFERSVEHAVRDLRNRGASASVEAVVAEDPSLRRWGWDRLGRAISLALQKVK